MNNQLTVKQANTLHIKQVSINDDRGESNFSEQSVVSEISNQDNTNRQQSQKVGSYEWEVEGGTADQKLQLKSQLNSKVQDIITQEKQREEEEQLKLITQILQIEDYILKNNNMIDFRRNLKKKIALFSVFILILIAERILYTVLIDKEEDLLEYFQKYFKLMQLKGDAHYSEFTNNFFFQMIAFGTSFHKSMLLITHFFVTIFVAISDFIAIKLIFTTLIGLYFISLLQLFYDGPLPYWTSEMIASPSCVTTNGHPCRPVFTFLFITYYYLYCLKVRIQRNQNQNEEQKIGLLKKIYLVQVVSAFVFVFYSLCLYLSGLTFLINIALGFIMFFFYYTLISQKNHYVSKVLSNVSIHTQEAKKKIFLWFINLIVMIFFSYIAFLGSQRFVNLSWIANYLNCTRESSISFTEDQLIGPYHTLSIVSVLGGLAGTIFGLNHTYNHLSQQCVKRWYKGILSKRLLRVLIINIFLIPSWVLCFYQTSLLREDFVINLGFNEFILDTLHYFFLYLFLFGFVPVYIFQPLKLVHTKNENEQSDRTMTILNSSFVYS